MIITFWDFYDWEVQVEMPKEEQKRRKKNYKILRGEKITKRRKIVKKNNHKGEKKNL